jgi:hypothetical protein
MLIQPKLFAAEQGDSAFWKDFDWDLAARAGMQRVGLPYSGEYEFVETAMYWPINHMVSPKEETVSCAECHTRNEGRLASLTGFYMPGRDQNKGVDSAGNILIWLTLIGVLGHATARIFNTIKKKEMDTLVINNEDKENID